MPWSPRFREVSRTSNGISVRPRRCGTHSRGRCSRLTNSRSMSAIWAKLSTRHSPPARHLTPRSRTYRPYPARPGENLKPWSVSHDPRQGNSVCRPPARSNHTNCCCRNCRRNSPRTRRHSTRWDATSPFCQRRWAATPPLPPRFWQRPWTNTAYRLKTRWRLPGRWPTWWT